MPRIRYLSAHANTRMKARSNLNASDYETFSSQIPSPPRINQRWTNLPTSPATKVTGIMFDHVTSFRRYIIPNYIPGIHTYAAYRACPLLHIWEKIRNVVSEVIERRVLTDTQYRDDGTGLTGKFGLHTAIWPWSKTSRRAGIGWVGSSFDLPTVPWRWDEFWRGKFDLHMLLLGWGGGAD